MQYNDKCTGLDCDQSYAYPYCTMGYYCYDHTPDDKARKKLKAQGRDVVDLRCRDAWATADCPENTHKQHCRMVKYLCEEEMVDFERDLLDGVTTDDGVKMGEEEYSKWFCNWEELHPET